MQLVKVGLCAFGMSGKVFHAPFLDQHPGFSLAAVVERSKDEVKLQYPTTLRYTSVQEMLSLAEISVVVVNTPVQLHFLHTKLALEAGKHVIVEKPFTVNAKEAEELVTLAKEKKLFLSVYQNRRLDRDYQMVQSILSQGNLGTVKEAEIRFDRYRTEPGSKEHKENPDLPGSGALHDLGAHLIDQATQLFGVPEKLFADVFSMKGANFANDYFEILLYYKNKLRVRIKSSVFSKEAQYAYIIHGKNGSFLQERTDNQENELLAGALPVYREDWTTPLAEADGILNIQTADGITKRTITRSRPGNYMHYYDEIYEHIVFQAALPSPGTEIIANIQIIEAALISSKEGRVVFL